MEGQEYNLNDSGERVIAASRRPDGTWRKEIRVKAGYVPQDEQPVYVPRGAAVMKGGPKVPGLDNEELERRKADARSKAAKKNEKRKEKKKTEPGKEPDIAERMKVMGLSGVSPSSKPRPPPNDDSAGPPGFPPGLGPPAPPPPEGPGTSELADGGTECLQKSAEDIQKLLRGLKKKIRQAEAIAQKKVEGKQLEVTEVEKLSKLESWRQEAAVLEHSL